MYLEGLGFRAIGRVLGIGHSTVYYWVKALDIKHQDTYNANLTQNDELIDIIELDEIHRYNQFKKTTARNRQSKHILGFVCGKQDKNL